MRFHVAQLLKEPVGSVRRFAIDEPLDLADEQFEVIGPIEGGVWLMRTNAGILASGSFHFSISIACGRCLADFEHPVDLQFEEEFKPSINMTTGLPIRYDADDDSFRIDDHHILDLGEAIRQYTLTAVPMLPLCREDCAGLCPTCGQDRNDAPCGCAPTDADSPFAVLKGLVVNDDAPRSG